MSSSTLLVGILDSAFVVNGPSAVLAYSHAFVDAYVPWSGGADGPDGPRSSIPVEVHLGALPATGGRRVGVHASKHPYWTFDATVGLEDGVTVWPRGIAVAIRDGGQRIEVTVGPDTSAARAGESLFHALRGVALYQRRAAHGSLLHASAVVLDGRAVAFTGSAGAGKTSLLTELVRSGAAAPLSNDRIRISHTGPLTASTWPSYASYCEGTLRTVPELHTAALAWEAGDPLRTQQWGTDLAMSFQKSHKRVYPMTWFTDAVGSRFEHAAPLDLLVVSRLDPAAEERHVRRLDPDAPADRRLLLDLLADNRFDHLEPSFLPWHGLPLPTPALDDAEVLDRFTATGTPIVSLTLGPGHLRDLAHHLEEVRACATT